MADQDSADAGLQARERDERHALSARIAPLSAEDIRDAVGRWPERESYATAQAATTAWFALRFRRKQWQLPPGTVLVGLVGEKAAARLITRAERGANPRARKSRGK